jgi:hypothetical protein
MKNIKELYHFEKFWQVYTRQNRSVSQWDERRTDMDVFINRTLSAWFAGKFFQVEIEQHKKDWLHPFDKPATEYKVFTKYVYITNIKFAFAPYHELITIYYIQPHSEKIEEVCWGWNEFINIKLMENEGDFRLLRKFYPIRVEAIELPQLKFIGQPIKERKVRVAKK